LVQGVNTFLLVLAAIFPIVNPPGTALVFLAITRGAPPELRRELARKVASNAFVVLVCSLLGGALVLQFYGISIPVLRTAGGFIVAVAGWRLLQEGSHKGIDDSDERDPRTSLMDQTFYPLTLPLTTGPGTIAVVISLGLSHPASMSTADQIISLAASLAAIVVITAAVFLCFAHADRVRSLLGQGGTDVAVRLSAFILFCLGVQILWSGCSELLRSALHS
jgi:multiple antibiotic resistance protein